MLHCDNKVWQCDGDIGQMWQKVRQFDKDEWQMLHCDNKKMWQCYLINMNDRCYTVTIKCGNAMVT